MAETKSKVAKTATAAKAKKLVADKLPGKTKSASKAKPSTHGDGTTYTKPELREQIKDTVMAGDKGGRSGQWSARKAQLVASEYEKKGGGYKKGGKNDAQKHLSSWTKEKWQTSDGKKAIKGERTSRYLPKKAWDELSPAEKEATDKKKVAASKTGQQVVANTPAAKKARKKATK